MSANLWVRHYSYNYFGCLFAHDSTIIWETIDQPLLWLIWGMVISLVKLRNIGEEEIRTVPVSRITCF